ncbi:unnamed protein product [Durusdinium trenchii]
MLPSSLASRRGTSRVTANVHVGEPPFRPAYGFEPASPLGPRAIEGEAVPGLQLWLSRMGLEEHLPAANEWCQEMGASVLEEVIDDLDDFTEALDIPEGDTDTLKKRGRVSFSNLLQRGEIPEQKAVVEAVEEFKASGRTFIKRTSQTQDS